MIRTSERIAKLPGYPLAEIPSIKRRLLEQGVDVIDLGAGDSDYPPPPPVIDALREALSDVRGFRSDVLAEPLPILHLRDRHSLE